MRFFSNLLISGLFLAVVSSQALADTSQPPAFRWVGGYGYLIVSSTYIWNNSVGLNNYKQHLQNLGAYVTVYDDVQINPSGNMKAKDKAANIHYWIRAWYDQCNAAGIQPKYVLLVGNPDTADNDQNGNPITGHVPMWVYQDPTYGTRIPTDFAYADLNSTWETDCNATLCLGRIPVYITATKNDIGNLDAYFSRMYDYSMSMETDNEWRRNILADAEPLGMSSIDNESYNWADTIVSDVKRIGWNFKRFYNPYVEHATPGYFLVPRLVNMNPLPECIYPSAANFATAWMTETPGIVFWQSHGSSDGLGGIISTNPSSPDYTYPLLNFSHPAMVMAASCHTSDPTNENNVGVRTLFANAIDYVGCTTDAGGTNCWMFFSYYLAVKGFCAGDAVNALKINSQNPADCMWFNLYGCPEAALNLPYVRSVQAPQNLSAHALSMTQIRLTWDVNPNAASYTVQRSTDFSFKRAGFTTIAKIPNGSTLTSYDDGNLTPWTKYKYRISYVLSGSTDSSGYSIIDSASTFDPWGNNPAPQTPSSIGASRGSNSANLSWSAVKGAISYCVKRSVSSAGPFVTIVNKGIDTTTFLDSNLMNNTTYYYTVSAANWYGQSSNYSAPISVTPASALSTPQLSNVAKTTTGGFPYVIGCYYSTTVHNELGFRFEMAIKFPDGSYGPFQTLFYAQRRNTLSGIWWNQATNSPFGFRVCALNETTSSPYSNIFNYTTPADAANPVTIVPNGLTASTYGANQVSLSWKFTGTGTCDSTQVFYRPTGGTWQESGIAYPGASALVTITPNTTIQVYIRTINKPLSGEPAGAISCSEFITITSSDPCSGIQGGGGGLTGTVFGLTPPYTAGSEYCKATDGNINTYYDYSQANGAYTGLDFGSAKVIGKIRYYPRSSWASRMTGGKFQGSNTSSSSGFVDLYTISGTPPVQWNDVTITNSTAYRWVRYLSPNGGYGNIAEMEFYAPATQYTITASAGANGSISPSGSVKVNSGASQTFAITPNANYAVSTVMVDGSNMGAITTYPFTNVSSNHTISATFALNLQIEAENSTLSGTAYKATDHTGYSGSGFVAGFYNSTTAKDSFTVNAPVAGSYKVKLHYSAGNGASSNTGLYVNGTKIKNISCATTSNWNTWADETETVTLKAGNNGIVYKAMTSSTASINLDYLVVSQ